MYPYYTNGIFTYPLSASYPQPLSQYTAPLRHFLTQKQSYLDQRCISKTESDYMAMNRLLWMEHVNWTRMTITSIVFQLPDLPFVQKRLLQNATDLGNCLRPFYGDQIADHYAKLIQDHLVIAAELVTAAVKGDTNTVNAKEKEWYKNADDIVLFLSNINPYLRKDDLQEMFYKHLELTENEAVTMIQKNYQADIEAFDQIETEALAMSDMIASAIVMQFYYRFRCPTN
ncbi:hypothetical protein B857_01676 [Solibacillus isronensis B3W22]|uniref:Acetylglutamate kinase n=1 Tax=Solibacillus isronensis B3W22 TaxID=1224748 RepID=K1KZX2_9BACL|nr:hypothetical protein [Solibacillus isronensis]AMO87006.1 hypothetical protein SOLI23_16025 [Solibacillus silvestris]EKB45402.1 hypothetical protein B857_01676 [Solibacillus isronensis B3W22]